MRLPELKITQIKDLDTKIGIGVLRDAVGRHMVRLPKEKENFTLGHLAHFIANTDSYMETKSLEVYEVCHENEDYCSISIDFCPEVTGPERLNRIEVYCDYDDGTFIYAFDYKEIIALKLYAW